MKFKGRFLKKSAFDKQRVPRMPLLQRGASGASTGAEGASNVLRATG